MKTLLLLLSLLLLAPGHGRAAAPARPGATPPPRPKQKPVRFDPRQTEAQREAVAAANPAFAKMRRTGAIPAEWLRPPPDPYRLGPGDRLEIEMVDFPETRQQCMLLPDGMLYFHTLPGLKASGLTISEVQAQIENALSVDYKNPRTAMILREANNRRIWVMGRCRKPGVYSLEGPTTILEAIGRARGFDIARSLGDTEEIVDLQHAFLIRTGQVVPIDFTRLVREGDTTQNIYLKNDDYIYLPAASGARAYVLGTVSTPLVVDFREHLTLTAAIANAGGFAKGAYPQRIMIIRDSLTEPRVAIVNFHDIVRGKVSDVALEPKDIVWVPNSPYKRLEEYLNLVVTSFAKTVAANEGVRATSRSAQPVGVSVGVGAQ